MTDSITRPSLTRARDAAFELLLRKVNDGALDPEVAGEMLTNGLRATTRTLAALRRRGMGKQAITDAFQRKLGEARAAGDNKRALAAEFTLAVWGGMQADVAAYLSGEREQQR